MGEQRSRRNSEKEAFWREIVRRQRAGDLSVRAFCQKERLKETAFYHWRRELARRDQQRLANRPRTRRSSRRRVAGRAAGEKSSMETTPATFLPVRLDQRPRAIGVELALPSGAVLRVPLETRVEDVARLVVAVEGRLC